MSNRENLFVFDHPLIKHKITNIRKEETKTKDFYQNVNEIAGLMAYEILVNGANPAEMEIQFASSVTKQYNANNAAELGITIPADYVVIE